MISQVRPSFPGKFLSRAAISLARVRKCPSAFAPWREMRARTTRLESAPPVRIRDLLERECGRQQSETDEDRHQDMGCIHNTSPRTEISRNCRFLAVIPITRESASSAEGECVAWRFHLSSSVPGTRGRALDQVISTGYADFR